MFRIMMNGKIYWVIVIEVNLNYVGSIMIDFVILEVVDMFLNEKV